MRDKLKIVETIPDMTITPRSPKKSWKNIIKSFSLYDKGCFK